MNHSEPFNQLLNGSYFGAIDTLYTSTMGVWWIFILYFFTIFHTFYFSRSPSVTLFVSLTGGLALIYRFDYLTNTSHTIIYLLLAINLALVLFNVFGGD
jgi:ABC-type proline/glycine betaine transport system permease subunit